MDCLILFTSTSKLAKIREETIVSSSNKAKRMCSVPTLAAFRILASFLAFSNTALALGEYGK